MDKNKTMIQFFEWYLPSDGIFWNRTKAFAKRLAQDGFSSVWLPPAYKGAKGIYDVGYGVYDMYDLGEFNQKGSIPTKYGTKQEYIEAIEALHKEGICVLGDIVFNHRIGADEIEEVLAETYSIFDRTKLEEKEKKILAWTKYNFAGRNGVYSDFTWNWTHFDGTDWDEREKKKAIYQFKGKKWDCDVDTQYGNYDYLMGADLDMNNPDVVQELLNWGKWYIRTTKVDGFRLDAIKHIQFDYFTGWLLALKEEFKRPIYAVGEYWSGDIKNLLYYLEKCNYCMNLFDVPLHNKFHTISNANGTVDLRTLLKDTLIEQCPDYAVTFVDNHDTQIGQALESWVSNWVKPIAYAIILLQDKGTPCVFYGDYVGVLYQKIAPVAELPMLLQLRKRYAYGEQINYFDDENVLGFTRLGLEEKEGSAIAVVISDKLQGTKKMYVGKRYANQVFLDCLCHCLEAVVIDENGYGAFSVNGGSVSVWATKECYQTLRILY